MVVVFSQTIGTYCKQVWGENVTMSTTTKLFDQSCNIFFKRLTISLTYIRPWEVKIVSLNFWRPMYLPLWSLQSTTINDYATT